jgi:hypothetical protein
MSRLGKTAVTAATPVTAATLLVAAVTFISLASAWAAEGADTTPPNGALAGVRSPAAGTLELRLYASDVGLGLAGAEASLDQAVSAFVRLGTGLCPEFPFPGGSEPPPGECPDSVSAVPIALDTRSLSDGPHELRVRVTDAAANTSTLLDREIVISNATPAGAGPIATATVGVASRGGGGPSGRGGQLSQPPGLCRAPKLKMRLAARPLWYTRRHVAVLRFRRRYPFRGRLTCLVSGHRLSAPEGTRVGVFYRVWRRSFDRHRGPVRRLQKATLRVRNGRLRIKLGFRSGRTLIFRYRAQNGEVAKAKIRLAVPPRSRRRPWGPR